MLIEVFGKRLKNKLEIGVIFMESLLLSQDLFLNVRILERLGLIELPYQNGITK